MISFIIRRLIAAVFLLIIVSMVVFTNAPFQTVALRGSPFSFHADPQWICARSTRAADVNAFTCIKDPNDSQSASVIFAVWRCPGPCGDADRARIGAVVRPSTPPFTSRGPKVSVAEQTSGGRYALDVDRVFTVSSDDWVLELRAEGPVPDTNALRVITNDIYGQTV